MDFSTAAKLKRFPLLDASRGVACIGVVACHCGFAHYFHWYWGAMDFFFVMSGFLITRSLIINCDKGRGMPAFFLYRALRLLPAYVTMILLYELIIFLAGSRPPWESLPYLLFYQHTDVIVGTREIFPRVHEMVPYWSLVLEEHYYVLWGVLFCTLAHRRLRITPATALVGILLLVAAAALRKAGVNWWTLPGRYDGFLIGSIAGIIVFTPHKVCLGAKTIRWLFALGWIASAAAVVRLIWTGLISYRDLALYNEHRWLDVSCFALLSLVLVLGMVKLDSRGLHFGRIQNAFGFVGLVSYEVYLVHFPIVSILEQFSDFKFNGGGLLLMGITLLLSITIAYAMHKVLTSKALSKREEILAYMAAKFRPQGRTAAAAACTEALPCMAEEAKYPPARD